MLAKSIRRGRIAALSSICLILLIGAGRVEAQSETKTSTTDDVVKQLIDRLTAAEAEIQHLKTLVGGQPGPQPVKAEIVPGESQAPVTPRESTLGPNGPAAVLPAETAPAPATEPAPQQEESHDHMMEIPGGPALHFRGFFDFNFGVGQAANI